MEEATRQNEGAKPRILVVDDEPGVRMIVIAALRREKRYELFEAPDGTVAMAMLQQHSFDIVITDLVMPNFDGLRLMEWAQKNRPGTSWIILSGRATFDDAVKAVKLGAFDFVTKPMAMVDSLVVTVRNALHQRELLAAHEQIDRQLRERNERLTGCTYQLKKACELLCDQAGTIAKDLRQAGLIQRALLPRTPPHTPGLSVNTFCRPSRRVGGDLHDVVRLSERYLIAYVADAGTRGVSAVMLAMLFKHHLPLLKKGTHEPNQPADALSGVNRSLIEECGEPGLLMTVAYSVLDTVSGELTIASAGHPPVLLHRNEGKIEMVFPAGPALGLSEQSTFIQTRTHLHTGDRMLMYTDGLLETHTQGKRLTSDRIAQALGDRKLSGQSLLQSIAEISCPPERQSIQEDDITMLLLSRTEEPSMFFNSPPPPIPEARPTTADQENEVLIGSVDGQTVVTVPHRGTWGLCPSFHDACMGELNTGRDLTLDMSKCEYVDTTFLSVLFKVIDQASRRNVAVWIQGVRPEVRRRLEELGMKRVIARLATGAPKVPAEVTPLEAAPEIAQETYARRMSEAHEALPALNERNWREFCELLEGVRAELRDHEAAR